MHPFLVAVGRNKRRKNYFVFDKVHRNLDFEINIIEILWYTIFKWNIQKFASQLLSIFEQPIFQIFAGMVTILHNMLDL